MKSRGWSRLQAPSHTHLGGAVRWPRTELGCQLEHLSVASWLLHQQECQETASSETCPTVYLGNHSVTSSTFCWQGSYNLCQIEGEWTKKHPPDGCVFMAGSGQSAQDGMCVAAPSCENAVCHLVAGSLDDRLVLKNH